MKTDFLILGAGLAGLSAAYHLKGEDYLVLEKEREAGGVCRSYQIGGFTFDYTGHLLHFRKPEIKKWIIGLLGENIVSHDRKAFIFSNGVYTDYPFQANLFGLPKEVIKECLLGFIQAQHQNAIAPETPAENFEDWILKTLGEGIARHFMIPFNEKLWRRPLQQMTADWVAWLVPRPKLEDVINGALGISNKPMGYNPSFLYPREGGIQSLARKLTRQADRIRFNHEVRETHTLRREVILKNGESISYEQLITSLPLDLFIQKCVDLPQEMNEQAKKLEFISVQVVNLGIKRENLSEKHWVYFPESRYPFYRVGFPSNLSPCMAPEGMSSLSVEVSALPTQTIDQEELLSQVKKGLYECAILNPSDPIVVEDVRTIPHAYVIYNQDYSRVVPQIRHYLSQMGIHSIGRYGSWEHTSMEDALFQGKETALHLLALCQK